MEISPGGFCGVSAIGKLSYVSSCVYPGIKELGKKEIFFRQTDREKKSFLFPAGKQIFHFLQEQVGEGKRDNYFHLGKKYMGLLTVNKNYIYYVLYV